MKKLFLCAALVLACAIPAEAHKPSDSYLDLRVDGRQISGQWDLALRDLDHAIGIDADGDNAITWGELRRRREVVATYALERLAVAADGDACAVQPVDVLVDQLSDGAYAVLRFTADCAAPPQRLDLEYGLFFDFDPQHRGLLHVETPAGARTALFQDDQRQQHLDLAAGGVWQTVSEFWRDGVWHIWIGFDHILFLLALLIPAVLRRETDGWRAVADFGEALRETVKVVTAFTVAHSITLSLAALGIVELPSGLVESGIAASVVLAAVNNAVPLFSERRWLVAFAFGLLHGFGFASVLADRGLPRGALVVALLGFNAGVECGQLAIVLAFLPLAYLARRSWLYQRVTLLAGSACIAVLALVWLFERALDLRLLPS